MTDIMDEKKSKRYLISTIVILSFVVSFTVFFFPGMETYLCSLQEFSIGTGKTIPIMMSVAAIGGVVLSALLLSISRFKKAIHIVICELFGLLAASYIQMIAMNDGMNVLLDETVSASDSVSRNVINLLAYLFISQIPLIVYIIREKARDGSELKRELSFAKGRMIACISAVIFLMQAAGFGIYYGMLNIKDDEYQYRSYLSYEPMMNLSKEGNIVVFLTDRFEGTWTDELLDTYPELKTIFADFTLYQNNLSNWSNTFPSVPEMLTMKAYDGSSFRQYREEAWSGNTLIDILKNNGYNVNLALDHTTTYNGYTDIADKCDNMVLMDSDFDINCFGKGGVVSSFTCLSMAKLMPYCLKDHFLTTDNISYDYSDLPDRISPNVTSRSDYKFYQYVSDNNMTAASDKKVFEFIHLNFAHSIDENVAALSNDDSDNSDFGKTLRGEFSIIETYLTKMKEAGCYDNSTIIFVADHGRRPEEVEDGSGFVLEDVVTSTLMIKPAGYTGETLTTDTVSVLSNQYFAASVMEYAGIDHSEYGLSYNDVIENSLDEDRYMQCVKWLSWNQMQLCGKYKVEGDARNFDNWELLNGNDEPISVSQ